MNASLQRGVARWAARNAGRATLWAAVGLVLARGVGDMIAEDPQQVTPPAAARAAEQFPDGEARAFAVAFARSYLTVDDRRGGRDARRLRPFLSSDLSDQAAPAASPRGPGAAVAEAMVAREVPLGGSRALITVACFTRDGRTRYLTVPVARDGGRGLVVYDLPSFAAPPVTGTADAPPAAALDGTDGDEVRDLVERFVRAFIAGQDSAALAYFLAPGARVTPMGPGLSVEAVEEVGRLAGGGRRMFVAAIVRVREQASGATYRLRYRVAVERGDRWQVVSVAGGPRT